MKIFRAKPLHRHHVDGAHLGVIDRLLVKLEQKESGFNRQMFDQDFAKLFHSMRRRSGNLFEIVSNDDEFMKILLGNVDLRYNPHSIEETICELVEEIALSLIMYGKAYYFLYDDEKSAKKFIYSFDSSGVVRIFDYYLQFVPQRWINNFDRDDEVLSREIRILDFKKIMRFFMPTSIKRMLSAQNRTLAVLDRHQSEVSMFSPLVTYENPNPTNHFDFRVWRDTQDWVLYRATRSTGWNGRNYDSTKRSDFFDCHRLIRFRRNQLLLRDNILKQLSCELSRTGKGYKPEFSVEISGTDELPSVEHLDELEVRLSREEVGFTEIIDYCYKL